MLSPSKRMKRTITARDAFLSMFAEIAALQKIAW